MVKVGVYAAQLGNAIRRRNAFFAERNEFAFYIRPAIVGNRLPAYARAEQCGNFAVSVKHYAYRFKREFVCLFRRARLTGFRFFRFYLFGFFGLNLRRLWSYLDGGFILIVIILR